MVPSCCSENRRNFASNKNLRYIGSSSFLIHELMLLVLVIDCNERKCHNINRSFERVILLCFIYSGGQSAF